MSSINLSLAKFKEYLNQWAKLNEKGEQCLSQQVLGKPSEDLERIVIQIKTVLATMIEEYKKLVHSLNFEETLQNNDTVIPEELTLMKKCINMYDQEYMVKESIKSVVCSEGFTTHQHLASTIALWKSESYLDDEVQQKIKTMKI